MTLQLVHDGNGCLVTATEECRYRIWQEKVETEWRGEVTPGWNSAVISGDLERIVNAFQEFENSIIKLKGWSEKEKQEAVKEML